LFASNDASTLLLGLRFAPFRPIDHPTDRRRVIGNSLQTPRALSSADVHLLKSFGADADGWSTFVSYRRTPRDTRLATRLTSSLTSRGLHVFRDLNALRLGQAWWPAIERAIKRARFFLLVLGETTHKSTWVRRELACALRAGATVIPVQAGGSLDDWTDTPLSSKHVFDPNQQPLARLAEDIQHRIRTSAWHE
jgi:hypothetical protein